MNPLKEKIPTQSISRILVLIICVSILTTYSAAQKVVDFNNSNLRQISSINASQDAPTPTVIKGNVSCENLNSNNAAFPSITSNFGFKLEGTARLMSGTFAFTNDEGELTGNAPSDPNSSVTTNVTYSQNEPRTFTFTSTKSISAVIVKSGNQANVYVYDPAKMTSEGTLVTPAGQGISHIEFCYGSAASVTIIKEVTLNGGGTASTVSFPFTSNLLADKAFSLVDNNVVGPDRYTDSNYKAFQDPITVTENPFGTGFQLLDIVCTGGMTSVSLDNQTNGGTATIKVQPGDSVVCTFKNGQSGTTAAGADISGRVLTERGRGISRATVTVLDTNTLESRSVRTNAFGYFNMQEMPVGDFYIISVNSKGYWFANNNQGLTLTENLTNLQIIGTPFYFRNINGQISETNPK